MKLYISQNASITSENQADRLSKIVEVFALYIHAIQRNLVTVVPVSAAEQAALKISRVSTNDSLLIWSV
jgi:hypothetical protein